jgi:hypothetical protein
LIARFQKFSDQIENGHFHRTNDTVLRSCSSPSSPSSSGAVSGSNGFEVVLNGWYSLAIKPEKMRERKGGRTKRDRTGKILVPQPAANPRAFTAIVFVLNGEDWAETQTRKKNHGRGKESQN